MIWSRPSPSSRLSHRTAATRKAMSLSLGCEAGVGRKFLANSHYLWQRITRLIILSSKQRTWPRLDHFSSGYSGGNSPITARIIPPLQMDVSPVVSHARTDAQRFSRAECWWYFIIRVWRKCDSGSLISAGRSRLISFPFLAGGGSISPSQVGMNALSGRKNPGLRVRTRSRNTSWRNGKLEGEIRLFMATRDR